MRSKILDLLLPLTREPDSDQGSWLENAKDSIAVLKKNLKSDEILLYASGPALLHKSCSVGFTV